MTAGDDLGCQLYLITPEVIDLPQFLVQLAEALAGGPVAALQLRRKAADDAQMIAWSEAIRPLCHDAGCSLIINDRADLVMPCKADGVHLGQEDSDVAQARALLGPDLQIGVTCHNSRHLAMVAGEEGADYVAFGAFYPSNTKKTNHKADLNILTWWSSISSLPCVAIGGISPKNADPVIAAGADYLAISTGVFSWPDGPKAAVRDLYDITASHREQKKG